MKLAEFAVGRPVTLVMMGLCLLVLGVVSLSRLPLEQLPSISSSGVRVTATYRSSSPQEVERRITLPLEEILATLNNIESISSTSSPDGASVRVDFKPGTDMDLANMEVRERVDQVRGLLPEDLDRIQIYRWQSDQRAMVYASVGWRGEGDRLFDIVRKVVEPRLLRLDGVANVTVGGMEEKQLMVELDQERLEAHDVSLPVLASQVRANNANISLGRVLDAGQRYLVRALGEFGAVDEIGRLPLIGRSLHLQDLGDVSYDYPEKTHYERLNGVDAVTLRVFKAPTANVVDVAARVRAALDRIEAEYGGELEIEVVRDRAESVLREVDNLKTTALLGAILAVGIIFLFLRNIGSTLVIALAIPMAAMCVFTGMYLAREFLGSSITLNMVSMMGLMLAVGMMVDPAVVVLESIFRRREEEGSGALQAALSGSREVGMAVVASSLTTMCVFVPFFFLSQSRMSTWMRDAGVTICLAIAASMVVSLTVIPLATSRLFRKEYRRFDPGIKLLMLLGVAAAAGLKVYQEGWSGSRAWAVRWVERVGTSASDLEWAAALTLVAVLLLGAGLLWRLKRHGMRTTYVSVLHWTLDHRLATLAVTMGLLAAGIQLYRQIPQQGTPWTRERRVDISVEIDRSYSLDEVRRLFGAMEDIVQLGGVGGQDTFVLANVPIQSSIRVFINGVEQSAGWSFDANLNAVVFDPGSLPFVGDDIEVEYAYSNC